MMSSIKMAAEEASATPARETKSNISDLTDDLVEGLTKIMQ